MAFETFSHDNGVMIPNMHGNGVKMGIRWCCTHSNTLSKYESLIAAYVSVLVSGVSSVLTSSYDTVLRALNKTVA
jgi:hypothetical protein